MAKLKEKIKITSETTGTVPVLKELTLKEKELKVHEVARDQRVASVKAAIEAARLARVEKEKLGVAETEGAKLDREAKEKEDLAEASKLKVIEDFSVENAGNPDFNTVVVKLKEITDYLNKTKWE